MPLERRYCTFRLGGEWFGLEADRVREILRSPGFSPVPLASDLVKGLMNLRGEVLTVLDLRGRLGLAAPAPEKTMSLVLQSQGEWIALEIDEIGDVIEVEEGAFEETPQTLVGEARRLIRGAYKLKGRLMLALDLEESLVAEK